MGVEMNIIVGLGITSAILAYYGTFFFQNEDYLTQLVGQLFFSLSMIMLVLIINAGYLISANNGLIYLTEGIMGNAVQSFLYFLLIGALIYFLYLFIFIFKTIIESFKQRFSGRKKTNGDDK